MNTNCYLQTFVKWIEEHIVGIEQFYMWTVGRRVDVPGYKSCLRNLTGLITLLSSKILFKLAVLFCFKILQLFFRIVVNG